VFIEFPQGVQAKGSHFLEAEKLKKSQEEWSLQKPVEGLHRRFHIKRSLRSEEQRIRSCGGNSWKSH
jgi:hypothetical protein